MATVQEPSITLVSFNCPHCGALAHQTWYDTLLRSVNENETPYVPTRESIKEFTQGANIPQDIKDWYQARTERLIRGEIFENKLPDPIWSTFEFSNVFVSGCYSCKQLALWIGQNVVYPPRRHAEPPNDDLPDDIKVDFNEASTVLPLSPRSAAALLRLCIQKLCKFVLGQQSTDNLNQDIGKLVVAKGLDVRVQQALDVVRVTGNEAVHPGELDLRDDIETARQLFRLVNLIAEKTISEPKHVEAMFQALPEAKRDQIAKRDNKAR